MTDPSLGKAGWSAVILNVLLFDPETLKGLARVNASSYDKYRHASVSKQARKRLINAKAASGKRNHDSPPIKIDSFSGMPRIWPTNSSSENYTARNAIAAACEWFGIGAATRAGLLTVTLRFLLPRFCSDNQPIRSSQWGFHFGISSSSETERGPNRNIKPQVVTD